FMKYVNLTSLGKCLGQSQSGGRCNKRICSDLEKASFVHFERAKLDDIVDGSLCRLHKSQTAIIVSRWRRRLSRVSDEVRNAQQRRDMLQHRILRKQYLQLERRQKRDKLRLQRRRQFSLCRQKNRGIPTKAATSESIPDGQ
ncbi:hypothetical protein Brms1b_013644, partial [Colletotrichum noveboracense]